MKISQKMRLGLLSFSSIALLAACNDDTVDTSPVETGEEEAGTLPENTEEGTDTEETDQASQEDPTDEETGGESADTGNIEGDPDSPGIQGIEFSVSVFDAIDIFNQEFDTPYIEEIQFERDDGRYVYEFEGWDGEFDYEMDIDAETGEILSQETDSDSDEEDILDLEGIITPQEAMEIALEASGGDYVEEWQLELEDGYTVYDIDIEGGEDQDIDAHTGEIR